MPDHRYEPVGRKKPPSKRTEQQQKERRGEEEVKVDLMERRRREAGEDRLHGGNGDDMLFGGDGADRLQGGRGDDALDGGAGDDRMVGGKGNDVQTGGEGADRFVFAADDGADIVTDLSFDQGDSVKFRGERLIDSDEDLNRFIETLEADGRADTGVSISGDDLVIQYFATEVTLTGFADAWVEAV